MQDSVIDAGVMVMMMATQVVTFEGGIGSSGKVAGTTAWRVSYNE